MADPAALPANQPCPPAWQALRVCLCIVIFNLADPVYEPLAAWVSSQTQCQTAEESDHGASFRQGPELSGLCRDKPANTLCVTHCFRSLNFHVNKGFELQATSAGLYCAPTIQVAASNGHSKPVAGWCSLSRSNPCSLQSKESVTTMARMHMFP